MRDFRPRRTRSFTVRETIGLKVPFPRENDRVTVESRRGGNDVLLYIRHPAGKYEEKLQGRLDRKQSRLVGEYSGYGQFEIRSEKSQAGSRLHCEVHVDGRDPDGDGAAGCWMADEDDTRDRAEGS